MKPEKPHTRLHDRLQSAQGMADVFDLVKDVAHQTAGARRAGLMLGLGDLGYSPQGFVGAYYPADSNLIVVNERVLSLVQKKEPALFNAYLFHVLMHEYVHALGEYDEAQCRKRVAAICREAFGEKHAVTRLASDPAFLAPLMYAEPAKEQPMQSPVRLVHGFDRDAVRHYS